MNYLAHIYLSGSDTELMIGNFIADAVKGSEWKTYPEEVQNGIMLHRAIDHFTDTHEIVRLSKARLHERYRHYSAVIVDIYYDHFLANGWNNYHDLSLNQFVNNTYYTLQTNEHILPERMRFVLQHMVKNNWLYNYKSLEGVETVMKGMSRRTSFNSGMENSTDELQAYYDEFKHEFETFFPLLRQFSKSKIASFE